MKLVTAIVRPEKLDEIIDAVIGNNGRGLTVSTVRGFGRQFGELADRTASMDMHTDGLPVYRRAVLLTKIRLDIVVLDQDVQAMLDAVAKHAHTGAIGDGKIWVSDVDSVLRVRTGEKDRDAVLTNALTTHGTSVSVAGMSWRNARGMFRKYTQAPEVPPLEGSTFTDPSIPSRGLLLPGPAGCR